MPRKKKIKYGCFQGHTPCTSDRFDVKVESYDTGCEDTWEEYIFNNLKDAQCYMKEWMGSSYPKEGLVPGMVYDIGNEYFEIRILTRGGKDE